MTNESDDGIKFQRFCSIMGVDVEDSMNENGKNEGMSPIVIPQLKTILSSNAHIYGFEKSTRSNSLL